jgi:hypothetical protein
MYNCRNTCSEIKKQEGKIRQVYAEYTCTTLRKHLQIRSCSTNIMLFLNNGVFHISNTALQAYEVTAPMARKLKQIIHLVSSTMVTLCYIVGRTALLI